MASHSAIERVLFSLVLIACAEVLKVESFELVVESDGIEIYKSNDWNVSKHLIPEGLSETSRCRLKRATRVRRDHRRCLLHYERIKIQTLRLAMIKNVGDKAAMSCYYCGDSKTKSMKGVVWYRVHHKLSQSKVFKVSEVTIDMHDREANNRVVITPDHNLLIKKTKVADSGGYFCRDSKEGKGLKYIMGDNLAEIMRTSKSFKVIYHLDVIPDRDDSFKLVSLTGILAPKAKPAFYMSSYNLVAKSRWDPWSLCSVCNKVGTRRRKGYCFVMKSYKRIPAKPWNVENLLRIYPNGIPCRSSLFKDIAQIASRPNVITVENCERKCHSRGKGSGAEVEINMKTNGTKIIKQSPVKRKFKIKHGKRLRIFCPGSTMSSRVFWINGSEYITPEKIKQDTGGRVEIDHMNSLVIDRVMLWDDGEYSCWFGRKLMATIRVRVVPVFEIDYKEVMRNFDYVLLSFVIDFMVMMLLIVVKHKHRKTQSVFRKPGKKPLNADSTTSQTGDTSTSMSSYKDNTAATPQYQPSDDNYHVVDETRKELGTPN